MNNKSVHYFIPNTLHIELKMHCAAIGMSMNEFVREAIIRYLREKKANCN